MINHLHYTGEVPAASVNYQYIQATSIFIIWIQSDNTLPTITFYEISEVFIGPCVSNQDVLTYNRSYPSRRLRRRGLQEFSEYLFNITTIDGDFRSATTTVIMKTLPTGGDQIFNRVLMLYLFRFICSILIIDKNTIGLVIEFYYLTGYLQFFHSAKCATTDYFSSSSQYNIHCY